MKKHIVLIEDDTDDLRIFLDAMKEVPGSYKCTYSSCPIKGLDMLKYINPDFLFVDYHLPSMNGLDVIADLKQNSLLQDTPSFLYTTDLSASVEQKAKELGVSACFKKPSSFTEMSNILRSLLMPIASSPYFFNTHRRKIS